MTYKWEILRISVSWGTYSCVQTWVQAHCCYKLSKAFQLSLLHSLVSRWLTEKEGNQSDWGFENIFQFWKWKVFDSPMPKIVYIESTQWFYLKQQQQKTGAGNRAQQSRSLNVLLEDWSLDPSIHIGWLTNTCNSSSKSTAPVLTLWHSAWKK